MEKIIEQPKELSVLGYYDTIVAGGGFAGIAAALAAARGGNKVLLLERMFMLGGLGTAGLVTIYLPLCDGRGHQVSFGLAEELLKLSIKNGYECRYPKPWLEGGTLKEKTAKRYQVQYNAAACAVLMEQELLKAGVEILYGTTVCDCVVEDDIITHLIVENKSGRSAYGCGNVIDCTGDADICKLSGEDTAVFSQGNVLAAWYCFCDETGYNLKMLGFSDIPDEFKAEEQKKNATQQKRYAGLEAKEISDMMIDSHASFFNHYLAGRTISSTHMPTTIASIPQIRMTRRVDGAYTMKRSEANTHFADSVGMFGNWRKQNDGEIYELPYSTLYGKKIKNLATAGRSISVDDSLWDLTRVIPVCSLSGEAVGTAAALSQNFGEVDMETLQTTLRQNGVKLHIDEVL